jgi:ribonucleoside-diphosphate reductase beta chain
MTIYIARTINVNIGSFCSIFWLKKAGKNLPGLFQSNEFIARDEGLHCQFACLLYSKLLHKVSPEKLNAMLLEAVTIETEFICAALPFGFTGMNAKLMTEYIQFTANFVLGMLGHPKVSSITQVLAISVL